MIVVCDTSPVSALFRIHKLDILEKLFGNVILPQVVWDELQLLSRWGYKPQEIVLLEWIEVKSAQNEEFLQGLFARLDPGEAEAIALAKELDADLLLIDEMKGRKIAQEEGLQIVGLLGVLLRAKQQGLLENIKETMEGLVEVTQFRIGKKLFTEILSLAGEE